MICRPDQRRLSEVRPLGKQGIESLEVGIVRIGIAARGVGLQAEPWFERSVFKSETHIRRCCPRLNSATAEPAELIDEFEVVVPTGFPPPNPRAQRVPEFMGRPLIEARTLPIQAKIVKVNISARQPGDGSHG